MPETRTAAEPRLRLETLGPDASEWDACVAAAPNATFCHLSTWREILADVMGQEPRYLLARDAEGRIEGVLPMSLVRTPGLGRRLVSLPLLSYGGPLGSPAATRALVERAIEIARAQRATLELRMREECDSPLEPRARKVTVLLALPETPDALMAALRSKLRSQIRRPMKEGLHTVFGAGQVDPFYEVLRRNMRDLGTPVLPRRLFERVAELLANEVTFAVVYDGARPVAAGAGFQFRGEFEITWASSLREYSRSAPNMLLYWSLMEEMIRRGVHTFNFGRCTPGEGTHRFKLQWGGHDQPLPWLAWPDANEAAGPGRAASLAAEVWKRLPYGVANRLGPVVARRLPWW